MMYGPPLVGKSSILCRLIGVSFEELYGIIPSCSDSTVSGIYTSSVDSLPLSTSSTGHGKSATKVVTHSTGVANKVLQVTARKSTLVGIHAQSEGMGIKWDLMNIDLATDKY